MRFGEMGYWEIDKIALDSEVNKRAAIPAHHATNSFLPYIEII